MPLSHVERKMLSALSNRISVLRDLKQALIQSREQFEAELQKTGYQQSEAARHFWKHIDSLSKEVDSTITEFNDLQKTQD